MKTESVSVSQLFKTYTGTKTIKAAPMSVEEAKRNGAQITEETIKKNIGSDGYLVEYPDGYRSWSPKKAFEDAYRVSESYVDRMMIELADLKTRIVNATEAIYTPGRLTSGDRWAITKQLDAMRDYADKLYGRIQNELEPRTVSLIGPTCYSDEMKKEGE